MIPSQDNWSPVCIRFAKPLRGELMAGFFPRLRAAQGARLFCCAAFCGACLMTLGSAAAQTFPPPPIAVSEENDDPPGAVLPVQAQVSDDPPATVDPPLPANPANPGNLPELPDTVVPGTRTDGVTPLAPNAQGAPTDPSLPIPENTVVGPTRTPTLTGRNATSTTVITREQIEQSGQTNVAEVLRGTVGVDVVRQGSPGGVTSVFLRGANSQHTKVLLDGIPLNDPSNASRLFDFSTLSTDNIERIEVLRGPQSMVYGSDAIGGVINIVTIRGEGPLSVRASGYGGSFNTGKAGLSVSGGDEKKYYSVGGSFLSTGGISSASARLGNTEHDGFNIGTVSGRVGYNLGEGMNVDYVFRYVDAAAEIDDFDFFTGLPVDNLIRKNLSHNFANRVQLSWTGPDEKFTHRVGFSLNDYDREDTDGGPFVPPRFNGQTREIDYLASYAATEQHTLSVGANYLAEDAQSTFNPLVSQDIKGVFLQDQFQLFENFFGTAGVRWDDASRAGPAQTYRVTGLYRAPTNTNFHGSIGTGFRQPALAENLFQFGNPNLLPERSKGWDIGAQQTLVDGWIVFDATYFRNDFSNLIVFDFNTFALENVGRARSSGVELTLTVYLYEDLWVNAGYTLDDTLNLDTGAALLRRPRDKATVSLTKTWNEGRTAAILSMQHYSERLDTRNVILPPYTLLHLSGTHRMNDRVELLARLENLTNTEYEEINGFGSPGFAAYGGFSVVW